MRYSKRTLAKATVALAEKHPMNMVLQSLAMEMRQQHMTRDIAGMTHQLAIEMYTAKSHVLSEVISAHELTVATKKQITQFLKKKYTAKKVTISYHIDSTLVGGIKIITPFGVLNLSIAHQLDQLT